MTLVLPLTTRPKAPIFDLDLSAPGELGAHLLTRLKTAAYEAEQLLHLLDASDSAVAMRQGLSVDLLQAICAFTPGRFLEVAKEYSFSRPLAIAQYLYDGLGLTVRPMAHEVGEWLTHLEPAAARLSEALGEPPCRDSSSENVLLALPDMRNAPTSARQVAALVAAYAAGIGAAATEEDERVLSTLCEYGRRYEVLVAATVPIARRFTLSMAESRPLNRRARGWTVQRFALGDAASGHMEARVVDPSVAFGSFHVRDLSGVRIGLGRLESARKTTETIALYGSDPDRPYYAEVWIKLRLASFIRWGTALLGVLSLCAAVAVFFVPRDSLYVERLALLVVPTTLATAVVLTREQSALANQLQRWPRLLLTVAIAILWMTMLIELLAFHDSQPSTSSRNPSARVVIFSANRYDYRGSNG